jgi:hypothetical protein
MLRRNARDLGDDFLDLLLADDFFLFRFRQDALGRAGFVEHVDGLVGQMAVGDVFAASSAALLIAAAST